MGDVDFVLIVRVQNRDQMNDVIDDAIAIEGVEQTSSRFVMDEHRPDKGIVSNLPDAAKDTLFDD
jgi:DNA-binding Lrp family transcriptional regulator